MAPSTLLLLLLLLSSATLSLPHNNPQDDPLLPSRRTLKEDPQTFSPPKKKLNTTTTNKNTTNPLKPKSTNSTKKNTTKPLTPKSSNSSSTKTPTSSKNTTKPLTSKSTNSSSTTTNIKMLSTSKNTTKLLQSNSTTIKKNTTKLLQSNSTTIKKNTTTPKPLKTNSTKPSNSTANKKTVPIMPSFDDDDDDDGEGSQADLASELRSLPSRFHEAVVPDLRRISTTSRAYLSLASMEFTRSFRPLVGTTYATPLARLAFASLLLLPFLLAAYAFRQLRHHHLPLQKVALSASIYLAVYFSVLALAGAAAGTEPLRAFHAASPGAYVGTQVIMMMGYATYLLLLVVEAVAVGGRGAAAAAAAAGLRLALATGVGVHYYTAVFHRAVAGEPPRTSWRVHAVYAACFAAVCVLARAARGGKKEYLHGGGGQDCKTS